MGARCGCRPLSLRATTAPPPSHVDTHVSEMEQGKSLPRQAHQARIPAGRGRVDARHLLHHQPGQVVAAVGAVLDQGHDGAVAGGEGAAEAVGLVGGAGEEEGVDVGGGGVGREGDGGVGDGADQAAAEVVVGDERVVVGGEGGGELLEEGLEGRGEAGERAAGLEPQASCPRRWGRGAGA